MRMSGHVEVEYNHIPQMGDGILHACQMVVAKTVVDIAGAYQSGVGVDTGTLKNSISYLIGSGGLHGWVYTNISYAPYHEFGTRTTPANPALTRAFEARKSTFHLAMRAALGRIG